jgi:hypothetical protein
MRTMREATAAAAVGQAPRRPCDSLLFRYFHYARAVTCLVTCLITCCITRLITRLITCLVTCLITCFMTRMRGEAGEAARTCCDKYATSCDKYFAFVCVTGVAWIGDALRWMVMGCMVKWDSIARLSTL